MEDLWIDFKFGSKGSSQISAAWSFFGIWSGSGLSITASPEVELDLLFIISCSLLVIYSVVWEIEQRSRANKEIM